MATVCHRTACESAVTIAFLAWCSAQLAAQGFTAILLIWDDVPGTASQAERHWISQHNQLVKLGAGVEGVAGMR